MKDKDFGNLVWTYYDVWSTSVAIPYFRDYGQRLDTATSQEEEAVLFRKGRFLLTFDVNQTREPPSAAQRSAWNELVDRGENLWNELMDRILSEYRIQQPVRRKWWKAAFGDHLLDYVLPPPDRSTLAKLIRPVRINVKPVPRESQEAEIGIDFMATWIENGFGASIRNGKVQEVGAIDLALVRTVSPADIIVHPVFGPLHRDRQAHLWRGMLNCKVFQDFARVADDRSSFAENGVTAGGQDPESYVTWDFVKGDFLLELYTVGKITPRQAAAMRAFKSDLEANSMSVLKAIAEYYKKNYKRIRQSCTRDHADQVAPRINGLEDLHPLMDLQRVRVFPDFAERDGVALGFEFACTWDLDKLGVRWRAGKVEEVGARETSVPTLPKP